MYIDLKSYQNSVIICDFTVEFTKRYIPTGSRTRDQMDQAARSGKQNIAEASSSSKHKPKSELMLLAVASASFKELLEDYQDYLRQHNLKLWQKDDSRAVAVRNLVYTTDKSYGTYKPYIDDAEAACNSMLCLINQTTYLLDNQIRAVERQMEGKGISVETHNQRLRRIMVEQKKQEKEVDGIIAEILKQSKK